MSTGRTALPGGAPLRKSSAKRKKKSTNSATKSRSSKTKRMSSAAPSAQAKKPSAPKGAKSPGSKAKSAKPKPSCKYGPRLANGRCPTKPKKAKQLQKDVAAILKPTATKQEKAQAVNRIADAVATQVSRDVAANVKKQLRTSKAKETLKKVGSAALTVVKSPAFGVPAALVAGAVLGKTAVDRLAEDRVRKAEASMKKQYPNGFPPEIRGPLLAQHKKQAKKDLEIRPSLSGLR